MDLTFLFIEKLEKLNFQRQGFQKINEKVKNVKKYNVFVLYFCL